MSLFSTRLRILLEKNGINQVKLAKKTKLTPSQIHNYLNQNFRAITKDHLDAIVNEASDDPAERAELTKCYLLDVLPDSVRQYVDIQPVEEAKDNTSWYFEMERLPKVFRKTFENLYMMCAESSDARSHTKSFTTSLAVLLNRPQYLQDSGNTRRAS